MTTTISGTPGGEVYRQGNVTGTVSQVAGVPTGAIIESGSNSNGRFIKYADGTLICTHLVSVGAWSANASTFATWTYPTPFISTPVAVSTDTTGAPHAYNSGIAAGATTAQVFMGGTSGGAAASINVLAIGRWF